MPRRVASQIPKPPFTTHDQLCFSRYSPSEIKTIRRKLREIEFFQISTLRANLFSY